MPLPCLVLDCSLIYYCCVLLIAEPCPVLLLPLLLRHLRLPFTRQFCWCYYLVFVCYVVIPTLPLRCVTCCICCRLRCHVTFVVTLLLPLPYVVVTVTFTLLYLVIPCCYVDICVCCYTAVTLLLLLLLLIVTLRIVVAYVVPLPLYYIPDVCGCAIYGYICLPTRICCCVVVVACVYCCCHYTLRYVCAFVVTLLTYRLLLITDYVLLYLPALWLVIRLLLDYVVVTQRYLPVTLPRLLLRSVVVTFVVRCPLLCVIRTLTLRCIVLLFPTLFPTCCCCRCYHVYLRWVTFNLPICCVVVGCIATLLLFVCWYYRTFATCNLRLRLLLIVVVTLPPLAFTLYVG